ncbi:MAG TPA: DUF6106 family protein [Thermoclostridium sp.]|nr:DUF6106 family protein [Thermoclostridium sp.]HPU45667.1 DUF6106 family protein [Thermoclostridium sp.]
MDVFIEKIVRRKKTPVDITYMVMLFITALLASYFALLFLGFFAPIVIAGLFYVAYYLAAMRNIEYEYIVTNGDLDIDMIINQRKRKRVFSANCKEFEVVARVNSDQYTPQIRQTKTVPDYSSNDPQKEKWFVFMSQEGAQKVLLFEPEERMIDNFRTFIPRKVFK